MMGCGAGSQAWRPRTSATFVTHRHRSDIFRLESESYSWLKRVPLTGRTFFLPVSTCDGSDDGTEASRSGKWEMLHSINDPRASPQFHPERTGEITEKESTGKVSELSQSGKFPEAKSPQGGGCGMKGLSQ